MRIVQYPAFSPPSLHLPCKKITGIYTGSADLDIDAAVGVVRASAAAAVRAAAVTVAVAVVVSLAVVGLAVGAAGAVAVEPGEDGGEEEEDAVHDAKGEAGLEHGARLVDRGVDAVVRVGRAKGPKVDIEATAGADVYAVGVGNVAQIPDSGDEGTHKAEIDNGDKQGIGGRAVVAEEGEDGPGEREHRDDEQDEYVVGRQRIVLDVAVDEPGQHAHGGNLREKEVSWVVSGKYGASRRKEEGSHRHGVLSRQCDCYATRHECQTGRPQLTRVRICIKRQKAKKTANNMMKTATVANAQTSRKVCKVSKQLQVYSS